MGPFVYVKMIKSKNIALSHIFSNIPKLAPDDTYPRLVKYKIIARMYTEANIFDATNSY